MTIEGKPELATVQAVLEDRKRHRARLRTRVKEDLELYRQEYRIDLPANFHMVRTPTSTTVIDRLADRLGSGRALWHMEPRRGGQTEKDRVEDLEKAIQCIWFLAERRMKYNLTRGMAHHGASRGGICVKVQIDPRAMLKAPQREGRESESAFTARQMRHLYKSIASFPILIDVRPLESLFPDSETDGENDMIEWYQRRVGDIKRDFPNWTGWKVLFGKQTRLPNGKYGPQYTDDTFIEFGQVTTCEWRGAWVENEWIEITPGVKGPVRNVYGRPQYFMRPSGFGEPEGRPEDRYRSILRPGRDTFIAMTRLLSIIDTVSENEAYGATLLKKGDSGNATFDTSPNAKNEMDHPEAVRAYRPEGLQPQVLQALGVMEAVSEAGSVPNEAIGQQPLQRRGTTGMSGVGAAIVTGQASMIVDPLKATIDSLKSDVSSFILFCLGGGIPGLNFELPVYGQVSEKDYANVTLTPKLIDGHFGPVYVTTLLKEPEDDYARESAGIQALQAGFPLSFVLEHFFRQENSEALQRSMIARQIAFHPDMIQGYYVPRLMKRLAAIVQPSNAESMPMKSTPAPAGFVPPPPPMRRLGPGGGPAAAPPPGDPQAMSRAGVARGAGTMQGAPVAGAQPFVSGA